MRPLSRASWERWGVDIEASHEGGLAAPPLRCVTPAWRRRACVEAPASGLSAPYDYRSREPARPLVLSQGWLLGEEPPLQRRGSEAPRSVSRVRGGERLACSGPGDPVDRRSLGMRCER